jgi:hypothetical protein
MQGNGLVQSAQLVEAVRAPRANAQANVDLGEGPDSGGHAGGLYRIGPEHRGAAREILRP